VKDMKLVTVKMPETYIEGLDELVKIGRYSSRSEVIRIAVRDLLRKELWLRSNEYVFPGFQSRRSKVPI